MLGNDFSAAKLRMEIESGFFCFQQFLLLTASCVLDALLLPTQDNHLQRMRWLAELAETYLLPQFVVEKLQCGLWREPARHSASQLGSELIHHTNAFITCLKLSGYVHGKLKAIYHQLNIVCPKLNFQRKTFISFSFCLLHVVHC